MIRWILMLKEREGKGDKQTLTWGGVGGLNMINWILTMKVRGERDRQ